MALRARLLVLLGAVLFRAAAEADDWDEIFGDDDEVSNAVGTCSPDDQDSCTAEQLARHSRAQDLVNEGNVLIQSATNDADRSRALNLFLEAISIDNVTEWAVTANTNAGIALKQLNRVPEALVCLRWAVQLNPEFFFARLALANTLAEEREWVESDEHYAQALMLAPEGNDPPVRLGWAALLSRAVHHRVQERPSKALFVGRELDEEAYALAQPVLTAILDRSMFPRDSYVQTLSRLLWKAKKEKTRRKMLKLAVEAGVFTDHRQHPRYFDSNFASRVTANPYWDGDVPLKSLKKIRSKVPEFIREVERLESAEHIKEVQGEMVELLDMSSKRFWKYKEIMSQGALNLPSVQTAGFVGDVFDKTPLIGDPHGSVAYSVLGAGTRTESACANSNQMLACHLGLRIPAGSVKQLGISVGGEKRVWREGEWLCFDPSFENHMWNLASTPVTVLAVTFSHPSL